MEKTEKISKETEQKIKESYTKISLVKNLMGEIDEMLQKMSKEEFLIYVTTVEIPHSAILFSRKDQLGVGNEKN